MIIPLNNYNAISHCNAISHYIGFAGPAICFQNVDCHKTRPRWPASLSRRCQRCFLGVRWQDHVTNKAIHKRTSQPHIGQLIQAQRHSFFGHAVHLPPSVLCNATLRLTRDISMGRRRIANHRVGDGQGGGRVLRGRVSSKGTQGFQLPHPGTVLWTVNCGGKMQRP